MSRSSHQFDDRFFRLPPPTDFAKAFLTPVTLRVDTSVHPHESNPHRDTDAPRGSLQSRDRLAPPIDRSRLTTPAQFRHGGWQVRRRQVRDALAATLASEQRLDRFDNCGNSVAVFRSKEDPDTVLLKGNYCKDRFCVPCQQARGTTIANNLSDYVRNRQLRFLTLTLHSTTHTLAELITHLYASFSKLRRTKTWKSHVHGGVAVLEVKYNPSAKRWHPHFHILFEGRYYPQQDIKRSWQAITKTSSIVDVRAVKDAQHAVRYLCTYVTKGFKRQVADDPDRLQEQIVAMRGVTTAFTFGAWRPLKLTATPDPGELEYVADLYSILARARDGDQTATELVRRLFREHLPTTPRPPPLHTN